MAKEAAPDKQEPEKPASKSKGMKMSVIIGIIAGVIVVQLIIIFLLFRFVTSSGGQQSAVAATTNNQEKHKMNSSEPGEEEEFSADQKLVDFYETGRITTNPKASSQFVVINLGLVYRFRDEESMKEMKEKKGEGSAEAGAFPSKTQARIKGVINSVLGNFTADELLNKRDSLSAVFKTSLKPLFRENQLYLKDVILQEFILQ